MANADTPPIFTAVSSSARQLFLLLRCINISPKVQVQISEQGLRFSVEDSSVMESMAFLEKSLFTTFVFNSEQLVQRPKDTTEDEEDEAEDAEAGMPTFSISLPALLETLQIFGATDALKSNHYSSRDSAFPHAHAFSNSVLGMSSLCRLTYHSAGSPLTIVLTETGVTTTCDLVTYEPSFATDIPFDRQSIALKVIMRGSHLHDAIGELGANNPERLVVSANNTTKSFTMAATSDLGSALVEFHRDAGTHYNPSTADDANQASTAATAGGATGLLETFQISGSFMQSYKFSHISQAKRAMASATKVSVRADTQGVLSLQFMVENLEQSSVGEVGSASVSFIDFRFVPLVRDDNDSDEAEEEADAEQGEEVTEEDEGEEDEEQ